MKTEKIRNVYAEDWRYGDDNLTDNLPEEYQTHISLGYILLLVVLFGGFGFYLNSKNKKKEEEDYRSQQTNKITELENDIKTLKNSDSTPNATPALATTVKAKPDNKDVYWDNVKKSNKDSLVSRGLDPYEILGVSKTSSLTEISKTYHDYCRNFYQLNNTLPKNQEALDKYRLKSLAYNEIMDEKDLARKQKLGMKS